MNNADPVAQTFEAALTGVLAGVSIDVLPYQDQYPLHVAIRNVTNTGEPGSTILGETTLSSSGTSISDVITFTQRINIVAGEKYAIVMNYAGPHLSLAHAMVYGLQMAVSLL